MGHIPLECNIHLKSKTLNKKVKSLSHVWLFATPWTVAYQAPLSMGFFQARILEWVAISLSRRSSQPRDWTQVSCIVGKRFTVWATREVRPHGDIAERRAKFYFLSGGSSDAKEFSCFVVIFSPIHYFIANAALSTAASAKSLQSCPTLCDP